MKKKWPLLLASCLSIIAPLVAQQPGGNRAEALLARGKEALGGANLLSAVRALEVEGLRIREPGDDHAETDLYGFRLLLPGHFQSTDNPYRHTIQGPSFWMKDDTSSGIDLTESIRTTAQRSTRRRFAHSALTFLLSTVDGSPVPARLSPCGPDTGPAAECLAITTDGFTFKLRFDEATGRPSAILTETLFDGAPAVRIERLEDYRQVGGLWFPFRIDESVGGYHSVTRLSVVRVNGELSPSDFAEKK